MTRRAGRSVVVLSLADYESLEETLYLLSDPANAEHLRKSIADANAGKLFPHDLIE